MSLLHNSLNFPEITHLRYVSNKKYNNNIINVHLNVIRYMRAYVYKKYNVTIISCIYAYSHATLTVYVDSILIIIIGKPYTEKVIYIVPNN